MVGIEVGATKITRNDGSSIPLGHDTMPPDVLRRIADDLPHVRTIADSCELVSAYKIYAALVADALWTQQLGKEGDPPVALAVPGWWSPRALEQVRDAFSEQRINAVLVNDAEAAVAEYQAAGGELPERVAVVSLRANHTSVVMVRDCAGDPTALMSPTVVHDEGGQHLDTAVLRHLIQGHEDLGDAIDTTDPDVIAAARTSLAQCTALREALSMSAREATHLDIPGFAQRMLLVRSELDELAAPWADVAIGIVRTALDECAEPADTVLLTGGLAAMPLISQRMSADLALDIRVPDDPHLIVARGAERLLARRLEVDRAPNGVWSGLKRRAAALSRVFAAAPEMQRGPRVTELAPQDSPQDSRAELASRVTELAPQGPLVAPLITDSDATSDVATATATATTVDATTDTVRIRAIPEPSSEPSAELSSEPAPQRDLVTR